MNTDNCKHNGWMTWNEYQSTATDQLRKIKIAWTEIHILGILAK